MAEKDGKEKHANTEESDLDAIIMMEEILDKLKVLDYETNFLKQK